MNNDVKCAEIREQLSLLLYGELDFDREEGVESHLDSCAECREALERERAMHAALDRVEIVPSPALLESCRESFAERLAEEPAPSLHAGDPARMGGLWERFVDALALKPSAGWLRPVGAMALVALGFAGARMVPSNRYGGMSLADAGAAKVRYVEPSADGRVQIVLDETRQRIVSGRVDDEKIRALLLSASREPSDPSVRAETVNILIPSAQSSDVRGALVAALQHDQNIGVRMKAMEGLKPFAAEADVRGALIQVLMSDSNPGLRTQAIDVLTSGANGGVNRNVNRDTVAALQELIERGEQQGYVRERCRRVLETVNASLETY